MASASQIPKRNLGRQSWASAPTGRRASRINHPSQRRTAGRLRQRSQGMGGNCSRDHPKRGQQRRAIPQSRLRRASSLYTREPFGDGGCGLPRRFAPRNDSPDPLSFRGGPTGRRGNPSFLRWTGVWAAEVVGPYGKPIQPPKPAGAQRSVRARDREGWVEIAAKTIPKGGRRDCPGSALSAERVAGQIQVLPDDLRVQHGALGPKV